MLCMQTIIKVQWLYFKGNVRLYTLPMSKPKSISPISVCVTAEPSLSSLTPIRDGYADRCPFFGGILSRRIYDNMKPQSNIGKDKECMFNQQFFSMMLHFLIGSVDCILTSRWEKDQIERQVRTLRQLLFQPMMSFKS